MPSARHALLVLLVRLVIDTNRDLLILRSFEGIPILNVQEALAMLGISLE